MNQLLVRAGEIVQDSFHRMHCSNPTNYAVRQEIFAGDVSASGERLMKEVGEDPHTIRHTFMKEEEEHEHDVPDYSFIEEYHGYWKYSATSTLLINNEWRNEIPVWRFMIQGRFAEEVCSTGDIDILARVHDMLLQAHSHRHTDIDAKKFTPRGHSLVLDNDEYHIEFTGSWDCLTGTEYIILDTQRVWTAEFMAQSLIGRGM